MLILLSEGESIGKDLHFKLLCFHTKISRLGEFFCFKYQNEEISSP